MLTLVELREFWVAISARWQLDSLGQVLSAAGLLLLANVDIVVKRTVLRGGSTYLDALAILPGMHQQMTAPDLSKGEFPACAAMTTGYVFRVENSATTFYLQSVGRTGQVTVVKVSGLQRSNSGWAAVCGAFCDFSGTSFVSGLLTCAASTLSMACLLFCAVTGDSIATAALAMMMTARALQTRIIRRRGEPRWFGAPEPGVNSDLLVLLSQDRWVRIQGATDDVKAVTSGAWLSEPTSLERSLENLAKYLILLSIVLLHGASNPSKAVFAATLTLSTLCAHISNECLDSLVMHGRKLEISGQRIKYKRRLDLATELVSHFKRTDCFVAMGMIQPHQVADFLNVEQSRKSQTTASPNEASSLKGAVVM